MELTNNTILITGGSSGIGFELAKAFLQRGNTVIITGRDEARLAKAKAVLPELHTICSDAARREQIDELRVQIGARFPKLNMLINNAGIMRTINLNRPDPAGDLAEEIQPNLAGPIWLIEAFLPLLKQQPVSAIVNISSGLAFVPLPISPVYCATKAAMHSYTQSLRVQLQRTNVRIFELMPPATDTALLSGMSEEDRKATKPMNVSELVKAALKGLESDTLEIRPGQANGLRFMSRVAPNFILKQLSKSVAKMLDR